MKAKFISVSTYAQTLKQERVWKVWKSSPIKPSTDSFMKSWLPSPDLHKPAMAQCTSLILALKRQRQWDQTFKVILSYIELSQSGILCTLLSLSKTKTNTKFLCIPKLTVPWTVLRSDIYMVKRTPQLVILHTESVEGTGKPPNLSLE